MPKEKPCDHVWIYESKSCCYRLACKKCLRMTTAHHIKGEMPNKGEVVQFVEEEYSTIEMVKEKI